MARRFPGMDPYLEAQGIWPDFHDALASYIREVLQPLLPARYYAALNTREEVGLALEDDEVLYTDVAIKRGSAGQVSEPGVRSPRSGTGGGPVVLTLEPFRTRFVEVREARSGEHPGGRLVTVIEILSPSNKRPGPDRDAFALKQKEVFQSDVHWVEIDLLRAGRRHGGHPRVAAHCKAKGHDYLVVVSRAARRRPRLELEIYGFTVKDALPTVNVPLLAPDADVPLALAQAFDRAYETGPYQKIVDYDKPFEANRPS